MCVEEVVNFFQRRAAVRRGHYGNFAFLRKCQRRALVAEQGEVFNRRADEGNPSFSAGLGKIRPFAQKTVAWMNGVATLALGCGDDGVDIDIGGGPRAIQRHGRIREDAMLGIRIVAGIDGNALNAHVAGCAQDPDGDLTAVCNQNSFHHFPGLFLKDVAADYSAKGVDCLGRKLWRARDQLEYGPCDGQHISLCVLDLAFAKGDALAAAFANRKHVDIGCRRRIEMRAHVDGRCAHVERVMRTRNDAQREVQRAHEGAAVDISAAVHQIAFQFQTGMAAVALEADAFEANVVHEWHIEPEMAQGRRIRINAYSTAGQGIQLLLSKKGRSCRDPWA
nr:hypothetical protein [Pantoea sp. 18069]